MLKNCKINTIFFIILFHNFAPIIKLSSIEEWLSLTKEKLYPFKVPKALIKIKKKIIRSKILLRTGLLKFFQPQQQHFLEHLNLKFQLKQVNKELLLMLILILKLMEYFVLVFNILLNICC